VRVIPGGLGRIVVAPGGHKCKARCVYWFRRGTKIRLTALPFAGNRFVGWFGHSCSGQAACAVRLSRARSATARFAQTQAASWNPHVACKATPTTLEAILGKQVNSQGGALEAGGTFQPHLGGSSQRHLLNPPCFVGSEPTFVQIDGLVTSGFGRAPDGDYVGALTDPSHPEITNPYLKAIHAEIDHTWLNAHVAPPTTMKGGTKIDVQGFVYWDPGHVDQAFHFFSGWEIHPLSAWRPTGGLAVEMPPVFEWIHAAALLSPNAKVEED
jgi:hypothetical protein